MIIELLPILSGLYLATKNNQAKFKIDRTILTYDRSCPLRMDVPTDHRIISFAFKMQVYLQIIFTKQT